MVGSMLSRSFPVISELSHLNIDKNLVRNSSYPLGRAAQVQLVLEIH